MQQVVWLQKFGWLAGAIAPSLFLFGPLCREAMAQTVNADGTVGTVVTGTGPFTITGGTVQDTNLFHSFTNFSPGSATTIFNLSDPNITAIFSRVTGNSVSNIDGILSVVGGADPDFFLMNPNGIVFGPNAQLDLNGSFVASTASSILFPNGVEFAAHDATVSPLLTINRPIGLQMGNNPGPIQINDTGQNLVRGTFFLPTDRTTLTTSPLQVDPENIGNPGNTLALLGGEITSVGGVLMAESGNVELGAAQDATVGLGAIATGWTFDYSQVTSFGDIRLTQDSLVDVSSAAGFSAGSARLQGASVTLDDGSMVLGQNTGTNAGGGIRVFATDTVRLAGIASTTVARSSLRTEGLSAGSSGSIEVRANRLETRNQAPLQTVTFGTGTASPVTVDVEQFDALEGTFFGSITFGNGNAENVLVKAKTLNALDGSILGSFTLNNPLFPFNTGSAGDVQFIADTINVQGANTEFSSAGGLGSVSFGSGSGGNININARQIEIRDGGRISTEISASGAAGNLNITATERIVVRDTPTTGEDTGIFASGKTQSPFTQFLFNLPTRPSGNSGNVNIQTPYLEVREQGAVTARNEGTGNSGSVNINGEIVYLNTGGNLSTSTFSGEGGDINLNLQELLLLRRGSFISTEAGGTGNGGNIRIFAPVIAGYENSDIIANAFQGNGGNINITTQGIFGLVFRDRLTPENDITASSEFGLNGTFTVNEFSLDPSSGLVELDIALKDESDQVNAACAATGNSEFIATGRGGIPPAPEAQNRDRPWQDTRDLTPFLDTPTSIPAPESQVKPQWREATIFQTLSNGQVLLVSMDDSVLTSAQFAHCAILRRQAQTPAP